MVISLKRKRNKSVWTFLFYCSAFFAIIAKDDGSCGKCHALFLTSIFTPQPMARLTPLHMGGYYSDPEIPIDQSQTHMVFGVRCIETKTVIQQQRQQQQRGQEKQREQIVIIGLQPDDNAAKSTDKEKMDFSNINNPWWEKLEYGQAMVNYLQTNNNKNNDQIHHNDWAGKSILEVGGSSTCLALCFGAKSVLVCHPDPQRLQILKHAHLFLNSNKNSSCHLQTSILSKDDPLPNETKNEKENTDSINCNGFDFIIFTMGGLNRLSEAYNMKKDKNDTICRILLPSCIIPPQQLQQYNYIESNGIIEILHEKIKEKCPNHSLQNS